MNLYVVLAIVFLVLVVLAVGRLFWSASHGRIETEAGGSFGRQALGSPHERERPEDWLDE